MTKYNSKIKHWTIYEQNKSGILSQRRIQPKFSYQQNPCKSLSTNSNVGKVFKLGNYKAPDNTKILYLEKVKPSDILVGSELSNFIRKYPKGVYIWTNIVSNHQYVGSSVNMLVRIRQYYYVGSRADSVIKRALTKYSTDGFSLIIISVLSEEERAILILEQLFLDNYEMYCIIMS